ncbi:MAG: hypothetical protein QXV03_01585 [Sulfolobales archaeon]
MNNSSPMALGNPVNPESRRRGEGVAMWGEPVPSKSKTTEITKTTTLMGAGNHS